MSFITTAILNLKSLSWLPIFNFLRVANYFAPINETLSAKESHAQSIQHNFTFSNV